MYHSLFIHFPYWRTSWLLPSFGNYEWSFSIRVCCVSQNGNMVTYISFFFLSYVLALLRHNSHITLYKFKVHNMMISYAYVNHNELTPPSPHIVTCVCVCVCVLRTFKIYSFSNWASLVVQLVKNLPAMQETLVWFLGGEDPPGEGNGNPFQYFCLENSVDRGAW